MDTSGARLWLILWKAYDSLREHAYRHIASLHLGLSDFAILEVLLHNGPQPINAMSGRVGLTSGSLTVAVDRLEHKLLVKRRNSPKDRRTRVVHLTDAGEHLIRCAFADHEAAMDRATSGLSSDERAQAIVLLKKLGLSAQAMLER